MNYKAKGMHAAAEGLASAVRDKGKTARTILPRGRKPSVRLLDSWDMTGPTKAIVMPDKSNEDTALMRRFTRLTNAHSKKIENHCHMIALYTVWYNWARINSAIRCSPAMAAGLTDKLMSMSDIAMMCEPKAPAKRGTYNKGSNSK